MRGPVSHLTKGVAIYGAGDAAINVVNVLLLPVYIQFLSTSNYGALALIIGVEAFAKIVSRWGLDGAFMRFYHEREAGPDRTRLASTLLWFMLGVNGVLLATSLGIAGWLASVVAIDAASVPALRVMLVNIFLIGFTFVPFHVMRLENAAASYAALTFARSAGTLVLRIALVMGLGLGVTGIYLADLALTLALLPFLWPWFRPLLAMQFSTTELGRALRFGLPRVPHGLALQWLDNGPKFLLGQHVSTAELGVYQNGTTLGTGVRFFTSAFETAWAPFYYKTSRQPDAKEVLGKMVTYGAAVLVLLAAGTIAVAPDVILVLLDRRYLAALPVIPIIAAGLACQGVYLLTSIGLNLTSRTEFYPMATMVAAAAGFSAGLWLIPHYGVVGAAVTVLLSYVTQAGLACAFAQRFYPMRYEGGRLLRVIFCGAAAAAAARWGVPSMPPLPGFFVHGVVTMVVYAGLLFVSGFFRRTEIAAAREFMVRGFRQIAVRTGAGPRA